MTAMEQRLARIARMEAIYDRARALVDTLLETGQGELDWNGDFQALEDYYFSPLWLSDFDADRAGEIPKDMKRGILTEDAIYDLLTDKERLRGILAKPEDISYRYLDKQDFSRYAPSLFDLLYRNMSRIAPSDAGYEADYRQWLDSFGAAFLGTPRKLVLIWHRDALIGFFMYAAVTDTFRMEEIQLEPAYHGRCGIFRGLYRFVLAELPDTICYTEAYAHVKNRKSIAILEKLGLKNTGTNQNGDCYHFKGDLCALLAWFSG